MSRPPPAPAQLALGGMPIAKLSDRLFFAVHPDADTAARIHALAAALCREHGVQARPLPAERLHVTLHHLGDFAGVPDALLAQARDAAAQVAAAQVVTVPFEVAFDRVSSFAGRARGRPCVLRGGEGDNAELAQLRQALGERLRGRGVKLPDRNAFTPHVTLFYADALLAERAVPPLTWRVREFALVHSLLGQSRHVELARWSLRG